MKRTSHLIMICIALIASSSRAESESPLCGEWRGSRPPNGSTRPNVQTWILTFRADQSFSLGFLEGTVPVPGIEGSYKATDTNVVLQLPKMPAIAASYSIAETNLTIGISALTTMLGGGGRR